MNYFRRAWLYVTRKLSKSILLGLTFLAIGNLVLIGLGITQAASNAKTMTRLSMKAVVNLNVDYQKHSAYIDSLESEEEKNAAYENSPVIGIDTVKDVLKDKRIKAANYLSSRQTFSLGFDSILIGNEEFREDSFSPNGASIENSYLQPNFMLIGNLYPEMIEFHDGTCTLVEGRFFNQNDIENANLVAVISKDVADINGFTLGDKISFRAGTEEIIQSMELNGLKRDDLNREFEIIGIYTTIEEVDMTSVRIAYITGSENPKNNVYVPLTTLIEGELVQYELFNKYGNSGMSMNANEIPLEDIKQQMLNTSKVNILLDDPLKVESFMDDYKNIETEYIYFDANNKQFDQFSRPLDNLTYFADVILLIISITAIFIITLITALTLKSREFEIGVLLSLGVSRTKIVMQFFVELLIILLVSFTCAVVTGSMVAGKVGQQVLENQVAIEPEIVQEENFKPNWVGYKEYFTEITQEDMLSRYKVTINPILILQIYLFGIGIVFISILVPTYMIMKLSPKRIMLS